jgi:ABC-type glutathione transport system ATPase component
VSSQVSVALNSSPSPSDLDASADPSLKRLVVDAQNISLTFETADGRVEALSNVSLQVAEGDFVSFIGPSGCGKTTMLRVIADLQQPSSGTLLVNGMTAENARRGRCYGYVFQAPALFPWRTIEKNLKLPLEVMGFRKSDRHRPSGQFDHPSGSRVAGCTGRVAGAEGLARPLTRHSSRILGPAFERAGAFDHSPNSSISRWAMGEIGAPRRVTSS